MWIGRDGGDWGSCPMAGFVEPPGSATIMIILFIYLGLFSQL
jgi:hypothetical protein